MFKQKYPEDKNDYNIVQNDSAFINYCNAEDVPDDINFTVMLDYNKDGTTSGMSLWNRELIFRTIRCNYIY